MADDNEKLKKHEMEMLKLMSSQPHPPFQEPFLSIPFQYHSPSSSENSSLFSGNSLSSISRHCRKKRKPKESGFSPQYATNTALSNI